ncbi:signal recognition particle-docking protein FtsY [Pollutimonas subterranea]|uniref:Signal recognition particle receptor FtsY n=1 Tax=Pollutimonas subterranea TaxID=2045210 RepID=A0A2N4U670_9BURK|nr:signal recognition particle-docking protein FtsY [Pollutimonas subterranea]PLC50518.1 signal recognition particle-docking protein FtsY [Pollutimonas subterranea]
MFSFFKRKKPSSVETGQQGSATPDEGSLSDQGLPEPQPTVEGPAEDAHPQQPLENAPIPEPLVEREAAQAPVDLLAPTALPAADTVQVDVAIQADIPGPAPELPSHTPMPTPEPSPDTPMPAPAEIEKSSWLTRLKKGLSRTGQNIGGLFVGVKVDESLFEDLETALIMADAGVEATEKLLTALRARVRKEKLSEAGQVKAALRDILADHLAPLEKPFPLGKASPLVIMIAGVNGAGKTTSIGKLAYAFQAQGAKVLLAAGDTFRAAAREQLMEWGARNNVTVIAQDGGDPAAVAFDAVNAGRAREASVVMVDTAGRLPTQLHLMEELKKIKRVIGKADGAAPHEVLLVIDGNTGQNAIAQIRAFDAAINLTGLVVTKLDGTAKGGTLAAVAAGSQGVRPVPVYWIGVGEALNDLQPFVAREFAAALIGD